MKLVSLKTLGDAGKEIAVNPEHIICMRESDSGGVEITVSGDKRIYVRGTLHSVARMVLPVEP